MLALPSPTHTLKQQPCAMGKEIDCIGFAYCCRVKPKVCAHVLIDCVIEAFMSPIRRRCVCERFWLREIDAEGLSSKGAINYRENFENMHFAQPVSKNSAQKVAYR